MTIFSVSRVRGPQNSETKTAAPSPVGTDSSMASAVTANGAGQQRERAVLRADTRVGTPVQRS